LQAPGVDPLQGHSNMYYSSKDHAGQREFTVMTNPGQLDNIVMIACVVGK
jgi:hypothetical protein